MTTPTPPPSLYTVDGAGKLTLNLHKGQARAWRSEKRFTFVIAGTQSGKTSLLPFWLYREIQRCGAGDYIAATATYDLFKLKFLPEMLRVFEDVLRVGRYWAGDNVIEIADPVTGLFSAKHAHDTMYARIILRSASSEGGLESASAKGAVLDECGQDKFKLEAWEAVLRRLSLSQGRVFGATTPYNVGWLKQHIFDQRRIRNDIAVFNFPSYLNPAFPRAEYDERKATMQAWKFAMFYDGLFEKPAALIYRDFLDTYREQGGHKVKPFAVPNEYPRYVGLDPGGAHVGKVWLAHDTRDNVFYLYREAEDGDKTIAQHAQAIKAYNERVITHYIGAKSESQYRRDYQAAGLTNVREPSVHEVESGIDRVVSLIKQHRLFVFDNCYGILDEIGRYSRQTDAAGNTLEGIKDKETFHRLDALRYAAVGVTTPQGVYFD